jgi:type IV pilus assembly protein PilB
MARIRIGERLVNDGAIDAAQLESALAHQRHWGGRLGQAIVRLGFLSEARLLEAVGAQIGAPLVVIGDRVIPPQVLALVPARILRARRAIPLEKLTEHRRGPLVVAFADPSDLGSVDEIAFATGLAIKAVLAAEWDVDQALDRHLGGGPTKRRAPVELPPDTSILPDPSKRGFFQ